MYKDVAEAIEDIQQKGYTHLFEVTGTNLRCKEKDEGYSINQVDIEESYHFDQGTAPGDDTSLYLIKTEGGVKGYLVGGTTMYKDREKAEFLDKLLQKT